MPLLSSCSNFLQTLNINFFQICHFRKIAICQDAPFLLSHLNIWPNPRWIFGTLAIFAEICLFLLNLPFCYYDRHLSRFPSLSPHLSFWQTFDGFLPNPPFSQFANFVKSPTVNIAGLYLTSRRPCWWSRTKAFLSSGNQLYFHVNSLRKIILYWSPTLPPCLVVSNQEWLFCGLI